MLTATPLSKAVNDLSAAGTPVPCVVQLPDLFFSRDETDLAAAKELCAQCPLKQMCLDQSLKTGEGHGVWGGLDEDERRRVIRRAARRRQGSRPITDLTPEQRKQDTDLHAKGVGTKRAADVIGVARHVIVKHRADNDLKPMTTHQRIPEDVADRIIEARNSGATYQQLAERFGVSSAGANIICRRAATKQDQAS